MINNKFTASRRSFLYAAAASTAGLGLGITPSKAAEESPLTVGTTTQSTITLNELVTNTKPQFTQKVYTDPVSGKKLSYNIFLPQNYSPQKKYPLVHFVGDISTVGQDVSLPLNQYGALIWADPSDQARHEAIVVVPSFPDIIILDTWNYWVSAWLEVLERFIAWLPWQYSIDPHRVYGTGQSMGCMASMYLANRNPSIFRAMMLVGGQWRTDQLRRLKESTFVYLAAEGDGRALQGQKEVKAMFDQEDVAYGQLASSWDARSGADSLNQRGLSLFSQKERRNFVTFTQGSVLAANPGADNEHVASFEVSYRIRTMRRWLLAQ